MKLSPHPFVSGISLALIGFGLGCEPDVAPSDSAFRSIEEIAYPPVEEGEWFYRDTLTRPPYPIPEAEPTGSLYEALTALANLSVLEMEKPLDEIPEPTPLTLGQFRAALTHESWSVRYGSCAVLGRYRCPKTAAILMEALLDEREEIALLALDGIVDQNEKWTMPRVIKTFGKHVNSVHLTVRIKAAARLLEWGNYSGVPILIKVLKEKTPIADELNRDWDKRERIAWEKDIALEALVGLTGDNYGYHPDASVPDQVSGAQAFESWWHENRAQLWQETPTWSDPQLLLTIHKIMGNLAAFQLRNVDNSRFLLEHLGPPVVPFLYEGIEKGPFYVRFHCLEVLTAMAENLGGSRKDQAVAAALLGSMDPETSVREQASTAIGALRPENAKTDSMPALKRSFETDPEIGVRKAAALALGRLGGSEAISILQSGLAQQDIAPSVRIATHAALARAGEKGFLETFLEGLQAESTSERMESLDVLILLTGSDFDLKPPLDPPPNMDQIRTLSAEIAKILSSG